MTQSASTFTNTTHYADAQCGLCHVFVRDLRLNAHIGLHPHERNTAQLIHIHIDAAIHEPQIPASNITDVVCYENLVAQVNTIVEMAGHVDLVETLAAQIAEQLMCDTRIARLRVRIEKPNAIAGAAMAGVEIERIKNGGRKNKQI